MGSQSGNFHPDQPVIGVSWDDAQAYIQWLGKRTGVAYRLPTEAQWEYAARGGEAYRYAGSDDPGAVAWYSANANNQTHVVGGKAPNGYGLYDMSGNVYEWCQDWYGDYSRRKANDPQGPARGPARVVRGGSFNGTARGCRGSYRYGSTPEFRDTGIGFRLARG
jgi:sulfatase modifying factor 1